MKVAIMLFLLALGFPEAAHSRQHEVKKPLSWDNLSDIKADIRDVKAEQRQIADQLNELKKLIAGNLAARPAPPPSQSLSSLVMRDEHFRGDNGAQIAMLVLGWRRMDMHGFLR